MRFHFPIIRRVSMPLLLLFQLLVVIILMSLSRWLFYIFNQTEFGHIDFFELIRLMFMGLRFDLSAVFMVNLPIIILLSIPVTIRYDQWYQRMTRILYVFANGLALAANMIDVIYFRYISKRTTYEVFQFFTNSEDNVVALFAQFFLDFWYILLIWFVFLYILYRASIVFVPGSPWPVRKFPWFIGQTILFLIWAGFSVIFIRGGLQLKPISLVTAGMRTSAQNIPLVLNTPFCIIKTIDQEALTEQVYFDENELEHIYTPAFHKLKLKNPEQGINLQGYNAVIIILESFGREHIGFYNNDEDASLTPFLDSLLAESYRFRAWSNGKRSIESLPAVVASIPTLMPVDYPSSPYITNRINGLGTLLGEEGYHTSFFHGGNNGTMSFDAFANTAGFVYYYGRNEYNNDDDFDGKWGIFDEPFLQYVADQMDQFPQPFLSGIFTLSSHHPYTIPEQYQDHFLNASSRLEESISYTDMALSGFFSKASNMDWFQNTVFIITADHTSESNEDPLYRTNLGNYAIPLAFYVPNGRLKGEGQFTAQQADIMPSLLALLGFNKPFVAFGANLFDTTARHFAINYNNNIYQLVEDDYILHFNGNQSLALFHMPDDPFMEVNLIRREDSVRNHKETFVKAIIQQYNSRLINNKLIVSE